MKRYLFVLLSAILSLPLSGQAPVSQESHIVNCILTWRGLGNLNSPLYLQGHINTRRVYAWYKTSMYFGQRIKSSETPAYTEDCVYRDGRLTDFRKSGSDRTYKIIWNGGDIIRIDAYDENGKTVKAVSANTVFMGAKRTFPYCFPDIDKTCTPYSRTNFPRNRECYPVKYRYMDVRREWSGYYYYVPTPGRVGEIWYVYWEINMQKKKGQISKAPVYSDEIKARIQYWSDGRAAAVGSKTAYYNSPEYFMEETVIY